MHSLRSIHNRFPQLAGTDLTHVYSGLKANDLVKVIHHLKFLPIILLYDGHIMTINKANETLINLLKGTEYDYFMHKSAAPFKMLGCRFMNDFCTKKWKWTMTRYGVCKRK